MSLSWKDKFLVGHQGIDAQHKALFEWAGSLLSAGSREMQVMVAKGLYDHTLTHFDFEERIMVKAEYPDTESHIVQHKALLKRLTEIAHGIADRSLHIPTLDECGQRICHHCKRRRYFYRRRWVFRVYGGLERIVLTPPWLLFVDIAPDHRGVMACNAVPVATLEVG